MRRIRKIYNSLFALLPLLNDIELGGSSNFTLGIGLLLVVLSVPFEILTVIKKKKRRNIPVFIYFFYLYFLFKCEWTPYYILYAITIICGLLGGVNGFINIDEVRKAIESVSKFAAVLVLIQTVVYYMFGFHIPFMIPALVDEGYSNAILTGVNNSMYRPSAFFLEPSHLASYTIVGLLSLMNKEMERNENTLKAQFLISMGIIFSTSGMGILLVFGAWVYKYFAMGFKLTRESIMKLTLFLGLFITVCVAALQIPFIQHIVARVFTSYNGYNAVQGRNFSMNWLFSTMSGHDWIWGVGYLNRPEYYTTAFILFTYALGIVGDILYALAFWSSFLQYSNLSKVYVIIFTALFFASGMTVSVTIIWWGTLILSGRMINEKKMRFKILRT